MQTPAIGMGRNVVPVLIESGSASMYSSTEIHSSFAQFYSFLQKKNHSENNWILGSFEQSPRFTEQYQAYLSTEDLAIMPAETQLREDLADAMRESPRDSGELILSWLRVFLTFIIFRVRASVEFIKSLRVAANFFNFKIQISLQKNLDATLTIEKKMLYIFVI